MQKVLILGHKGMLGNVVYSYLLTKIEKYTLLTTSARWGTDAFTLELSESDADYIINCVGLIPQKKPKEEEYQKVNVDLPIFLESLSKKIIHPSTDCEFSGNIPNTEKYSKGATRDAEDIYGKSKATISSLIEKTFTNTKIIRTSIIGHEENTHLSLLDWFLNSQHEVNGYTNHYWNGITTLQWAKLCEQLLDTWENYPVLNQYGTAEIRSKYELLEDIKQVYTKDIPIKPFNAPEAVNKCLTSDKEIPSIPEQLRELKNFYNK